MGGALYKVEMVVSDRCAIAEPHPWMVSDFIQSNINKGESPLTVKSIVSTLLDEVQE